MPLVQKHVTDYRRLVVADTMDAHLLLEWKIIALS